MNEVDTLYLEMKCKRSAEEMRIFIKRGFLATSFYYSEQIVSRRTVLFSPLATISRLASPKGVSLEVLTEATTEHQTVLEFVSKAVLMPRQHAEGPVLSVMPSVLGYATAIVLLGGIFGRPFS